MRMIKRLFSVEFLLIPFYTYNLVALFVFKKANLVLAILSRIIVTILILPLILAGIIILAIFYELMEGYLRLKHGDRFHAMLDGCDRVWVVKNASKNIINAIYYITPNDSSQLPEELRSFFVEKYSLITQTHPRFSSVIRSCLGLQYFHKVDLDLNACVKFMDDYANLAAFEDLMERYCNTDLPKGDTYLWEICIGRTPVRWYDGGKVYPLLVRYNHSMGDGVSLVALMTTHLLQDGVDLMRRKCDSYKAILNRHSDPDGGVANYLRKKFYYPTLSEPEKPNLLHRGEISGKKHLIFCWEKPDDEFIAKVKRIKRYYQVAFADVISTAISASLCDHFSKHEKVPTENVIAMNPYFLMSPDFNQLVHMNKDGVPITKLGNKFAMGFSKIPIDLDAQQKNNNVEKMADEDLIRRLRTVRQSNDRLKSALDFGFCYWQMRMFAGVPIQIGKALLHANESSLSISNVPGTSTARLTNGCEVRDTFVFGNNYATIGVTITLFTYDERFRVGLLIDKSLIAERMDAQLLGDGIFKYINALAATLPKAHQSSDFKTH